MADEPTLDFTPVNLDARPLYLYPPIAAAGGKDMSSINTLLREIRDQCRQPLSCDLTGDRTACAILHAWARQPWDEFHRKVLCDRMEETGRSELEMHWIRKVAVAWPPLSTVFLSQGRRFMRRCLKNWRSDLIRQFGDFESALTDTTL